MLLMEYKFGKFLQNLFNKAETHLRLNLFLRLYKLVTYVIIKKSTYQMSVLPFIK